MINIAVVEGNLTKDPVLKFAESGTAIATFRVAVDRFGKDKDTADYLNVVCFGKVAESVTKYLSQGSRVLIEGRIQSRTWEGDDGKRQYSTEVVGRTVTFLDAKKGGKKESDDEDW
jgi:single-strand DNA-binding protein